MQTTHSKWTSGTILILFGIKPIFSVLNMDFTSAILFARIIWCDLRAIYWKNKCFIIFFFHKPVGLNISLFKCPLLCLLLQVSGQVGQLMWLSVFMCCKQGWVPTASAKQIWVWDDPRILGISSQQPYQPPGTGVLLMLLLKM